MLSMLARALPTNPRNHIPFDTGSSSDQTVEIGVSLHLKKRNQDDDS